MVEIDIRRVIGIVDRTGEAEVFVGWEYVKDRLGPIELAADELRVLATGEAAAAEVHDPILVHRRTVERRTVGIRFAIFVVVAAAMSAVKYRTPDRSEGSLMPRGL